MTLDFATIAESRDAQLADAHNAALVAPSTAEQMLTELHEDGSIEMGNYTLEATDIQEELANMPENAEYAELLRTISAGDFAKLERIIEITRKAERRMCERYAGDYAKGTV